MSELLPIHGIGRAGYRSLGYVALMNYYIVTLKILLDLQFIQKGRFTPGKNYILLTEYNPLGPTSFASSSSTSFAITGRLNLVMKHMITFVSFT